MTQPTHCLVSLFRNSGSWLQNQTFIQLQSHRFQQPSSIKPAGQESLRCFPRSHPQHSCTEHAFSILNRMELLQSLPHLLSSSFSINGRTVHLQLHHSCSFPPKNSYLLHPNLLIRNQLFLQTDNRRQLSVHLPYSYFHAHQRSSKTRTFSYQ